MITKADNTHKLSVEEGFQEKVKSLLLAIDRYEHCVKHDLPIKEDARRDVFNYRNQVSKIVNGSEPTTDTE